MKLIGAMLILTGACGAYLGYRRSSLQVLRLARGLAEDLAILRCQICIHRRTLPSILTGDLGQGLGSIFFWSPLAVLLEQSGWTVRTCWETAAKALPAPLDACLAPLGVLLPAGGDTLACAIDEVRGELLALMRTQQEQQAVKLRLMAAMYFCSAALFILVCI